MITTLHHDYQNDEAVVGEIMVLIAPSYKNAGAHITKDIESCEDLYVTRDEEGQLLAIFMVGYHVINNRKCCYLGLSACRQDIKNKGLVKALYKQFANDCRQRERQGNDRILCYFTTATPIVYYWFCNNFASTQPDIDGNCSESARLMLNTIAEKKYRQATFTPETPFLLRHAAEQISYSDEENARIAEATAKLGLKVFERYSLNERNGDRFLMCCYVPGD